MSINLKKEQTKLNRKLEVVFNNSILLNGLKNTNFQSIIQKEINIIIFLEKKNGSKILKSSIWINAFNNATSKTFLLDEKIDYKDSDILFDDINHLTVYVKNIYKFDLDAAIEGKQTQVATPSVGEVPESNQQKSFADILPAMFGANAGSHDQFANVPPEQNPFYQQAANVRIQQEVKSGKLYLFKSKPRIMPFLKITLSLCLFLASASAIVLAVGLILVAYTQYFNGTNTIVDSVLVIILAIMSGYLGVMIGMPLIKRISKKANDNQLYYLNWRWLMAGAFTFTMVIIMLAVGNELSIIGVNSPIAHHDESLLWVGFIGIILLLSFAVLSVGLVLLTIHFNPEQDVERIRAIVSAYVAEAAANKTTPPAPPIIN